MPQLDERPIDEITISSMLRARAQKIPDDTAIVYGPDDDPISYAELNATANRIANGLRDIGVGRGTEVSVLAAHPRKTLEAMFGINKAGGVYSPVNTEYEGDPLAYQLDDTDPAVLVVEDQFLDRIAAIDDEIDTNPTVVVIGDATQRTDIETTPFEGVRTNDDTEPTVDIAWDDTASIVYTSGTTGMPKGVVIPHRWIFANYIGPKRAILNGDDVVHTSLPLYHIGGVYADVVAGIQAGGTVALWDQFSPREFWDRIDQYEATAATLISVMMPWLQNAPTTETDHETTLRKVHMQPLPETYEAMAERFGFEVISVAFAQTETGAPIVGIIRTDELQGTPPSYQRGRDPEAVETRAKELDLPVVEEVTDDRYMGRVREDIVEVAVLNDHDERVDVGEKGELCIRPKKPGLVLKSYHAKPERTAAAMRNLWFHTGDAVYRDEDGNFFFVDRLGDVIRRRGENISSMQIQDAVTTHDGVDSAAGFPIPAPEGGEDQIGLAVTPAGEAPLTEDVIRDHLDGLLPDFMHPDRLYIVDEIPTTATQKIEKYKLRNQLLNE